MASVDVFKKVLVFSAYTMELVIICMLLLNDFLEQKNDLFCNGGVYSLDKDLLMGDPSSLHFFLKVIYLLT